MTGSVSSKHTSWLPARRSLPLHQKLSTLPLLKARSNSIYFYLKGFVGSAHGCYSMVCMTSTQFTKMTNRPSAEFTVHVYPLHFMFWTHQNLKKKSRANAGILPKTEVLNKPSNHSIIPQQCLISLVIFLYSVSLPPFICAHASDSQQMNALFHSKPVAMSVYTSCSLYLAINPVANPWSCLHASNSLHSCSDL